MTNPDPMTPPECDLRGYEWMPLFGARLFASTFEAHASDLAFRVAVRLYWASWQQVPAASLPNDDTALCKLAGLGRDLKRWLRLRAAGVLHGFVLCADDRLYHRMLSLEAMKAWELGKKKDKIRDQTAERNRAWRERNVTRHNGQNDASPNASPNASRDASLARVDSVLKTQEDMTIQDKRDPPISPRHETRHETRHATGGRSRSPQKNGRSQPEFVSGAIELAYREGVLARANNEPTTIDPDETFDAFLARLR